MIFICLLSACSSAEQPHDKSSPYINLSSHEQELVQEPEQFQDQHQDPIMQDEQLTQNQESDTNQFLQGQKDQTQIISDETRAESNNQSQQEQDTQQQTIPVEPITEEKLEKQEAQNPEEQATQSAGVSTQLPFQDFKARWNAVTDEQLSNLYIKNLEEISAGEGKLYRAILTNHLELRVAVSDTYIQQLELISKDKSKSTITAMLTGWSQMINLLHPNIEIYDVDELFNKIGVAPNSNLTNVKQSSFTYSDIHYEVLPTENGYTFRAGYDKSQ